MFIDEVLARLDAVRPRSSDRWSARCPAHADRNPSLSIKACPDGMILVHCFCGCTAEEICGALGLQVTDLFADRRPGRRSSARPVKEKRVDWRRRAGQFEDHASALRDRAERVLQLATGRSIEGWSDAELDIALAALAKAYRDLERAAMLEGVAANVRLRELQQERNDHAPRGQRP